MYKNIGNKICKLAKLCGIVGAFAGVIGLFGFFVNIDHTEEKIIALAILIGGLLLLLSSWFMYAFGQITNDVHSMHERVKKDEVDQLADLPEL